MDSDVDLTCGLEVNTDQPIDDVAKSLAQALGAEVQGGGAMAGRHFYASVRKNRHFDEKKFASEKSFVYSRYIATIEPIDTEVDPDQYVKELCSAIRILRSEGMLITAGCEYEDIVKVETGWNWSEDDRVHP